LSFVWLFAQHNHETVRHNIMSLLPLGSKAMFMIIIYTRYQRYLVMNYVPLQFRFYELFSSYYGLLAVVFSTEKCLQSCSTCYISSQNESNKKTRNNWTNWTLPWHFFGEYRNWNTFFLIWNLNTEFDWSLDLCNLNIIPQV